MRGLIFLPLVLGICIATVALRYHYVIDVLAGILIATFCNLLAEKWMHWEVKTLSIRARAWRIFLRCFYGHIEVVEGHYSKIEGPTLVVSNHANAFVDPLMLQTAFAKKCRFTAKASLLRNPLTWLLMKGFGAIPLARPQDHDREERQKNNESAFQACIEALSQGQLVCIFPEGKSHSEIRMLPLKTGSARIAKAFLEQSKGALNILPVGLNYEKKAIFGSEVQIHFGPPLKLEHADIDIEDLTEQILVSLKSLTLNYEDESTSTLIPWIAKLLSLSGKSPVPIDQKQVLPESWVRSVQMIIEKENESRGHTTLNQLKEQAAQLQDEMRKCEVNPESLFLPMTWGKATYFVLRELEILIFAIIFLPFFAAIWVPMTILRLAVKKVTKDEDHFATHFLFLGFPFMVACWLLVGFFLWYFQFHLFMLIWIALGPFTLFTYIQCAMRWRKAWARTKDFFNLLLHRQKAQHFRARTIDLSDRLQKLLQSD